MLISIYSWGPFGYTVLNEVVGNWTWFTIRIAWMCWLMRTWMRPILNGFSPSFQLPAPSARPIRSMKLGAGSWEPGLSYFWEEQIWNVVSHERCLCTSSQLPAPRFPRFWLARSLSAHNCQPPYKLEIFTLCSGFLLQILFTEDGCRWCN
jgi:hypothetical protein